MDVIDGSILALSRGAGKNGTKSIAKRGSVHRGESRNDRNGDWGRDLVLYVARRRARMTLKISRRTTGGETTQSLPCPQWSWQGQPNPEEALCSRCAHNMRGGGVRDCCPGSEERQRLLQNPTAFRIPSNVQGTIGEGR